MIVEILVIFFIETFKMGQRQDEDFSRVFFCPHVYVPEQSLITGREKKVSTLFNSI